MKQSSSNKRSLSNKESKSQICPSGRVEVEGSHIFGIVAGTVSQPKVHYLREKISSDEELIGYTSSVSPTEVFRIASPCQEKQCPHFDGELCRLSMRVVENLPEVSKTLPSCTIRSDCRWWKQEGKAACFRCPQILTDNYYPSPLDIQVATPHNS